MAAKKGARSDAVGKGAKKPGRPATKTSPGSAAKKSPKRPARNPATATPPSGDAQLIMQRIRDLRDWRGETLGRMRELILDAQPGVVEEIKWRKPSNPDGVPVWSHEGMICTGEVYKDHVKLTFAQGARLADPARVFNASLDAGTRRAIDLREGDRVDEKAFRALVRDAAALNAMRTGKG